LQHRSDLSGGGTTLDKGKKKKRKKDRQRRIDRGKKEGVGEKVRREGNSRICIQFLYHHHTACHDGGREKGRKRRRKKA